MMLILLLLEKLIVGVVVIQKLVRIGLDGLIELLVCIMELFFLKMKF